LAKQVFVSRLADDTKKSISWLLDKLEFPETLTKICIKPNLNDYRKWETASTSDPYILDALLSVLKSCYPKASITIIENDATGVNADNIFSYLTIDSIANKHGCRCVNVAREQWNSININGLHFKSIEIPEILRGAFFITFPKLKTHTITKLTCGLKNQMGLFRSKRKVLYHYMIDELIVDCNLAMRADISIVDANLVMEGNYGPTYGSPSKLGLLIASNDIVAADSLCAKFYGLNPKSVSHIKKASQKGIGDMKYNILSDFDFDLRDYKLKFSKILFHLIRKGSAGIRR
jgi:uncharacterized protein (DUF362 family)